MTGKTRINADAIDIENKDLIVTSAEGIENNNNDITIPTSAAVAQALAIKAWVNFDGTGTPTIRDSFNVQSIT